jgi:hypothetical protein
LTTFGAAKYLMYQAGFSLSAGLNIKPILVFHQFGAAE